MFANYSTVLTLTFTFPSNLPIWVHFQLFNKVRYGRSSILYCDTADVAFGNSFVWALCDVIIIKTMTNVSAAAGVRAMPTRLMHLCE